MFVLSKLLGTILCAAGLLAGHSHVHAQAGNDSRLLVAFYNCEQFFDTVDNPGKDDNEFTPVGKYHYTQRIYEQKQHNIATVIQSMGEGAPGIYPALIGLAEVENSTVLNDLIHQPELARHNYKYVIYDGPDPRGINTALVYDPALFKVISSEPIRVGRYGLFEPVVTRDILHVCGVLAGDTVHVLVNHWPSRRGGVEESEQKRGSAAYTVKRYTDSLMRMRPATRIIVMGDLNDNPLDNTVNRVLGAATIRSSVRADGLYNPWADLFISGQGTESYKHQWNLFDQIIISGAFMGNGTGKWYYDQALIYKPVFLMDNYKGHEGEPRRSFAGPHWINGYSDHFPVLLYLKQ